MVEGRKLANISSSNLVGLYRNEHMYNALCIICFKKILVHIDIFTYMYIYIYIYIYTYMVPMHSQSPRAHGALHGSVGGADDPIKLYFEANNSLSSNRLDCFDICLRFFEANT